LPTGPGSAISPDFAARLIKGCRGDDLPGAFSRRPDRDDFGKTLALSTL
jgi:hypothetical protein